MYVDRMKGREEAFGSGKELRLKLDNSTLLLFWWPIGSVTHGPSGMPQAESTGYCLFAKELTDDGLMFRETLEVTQNKESGGFCLFSCQDFEVGDAITFISRLEERSEMLTFGGIYSRIANNATEANACLVGNRSLRCMKAISKGEEIVRLSEEESTDFFEKMDCVMISTQRMVIGPISSHQSRDGLTVKYSDGSKETAGPKANVLIAFQNLGN